MRDKRQHDFWRAARGGLESWATIPFPIIPHDRRPPGAPRCRDRSDHDIAGLDPPNSCVLTKMPEAKVNKTRTNSTKTFISRANGMSGLRPCVKRRPGYFFCLATERLIAYVCGAA
jgi:hypothetical protein